jgi:hypothetical protein
MVCFAMRQIREFSALVCLAFTFSLLTIYIQFNTAKLTLHLEFESDQSGLLQMLWRKDGAIYSSDKLWRKKVVKDKENIIELSLPTISQADYIVIYPINKDAEIVLRKFFFTYRDREYFDLLQGQTLSSLPVKDAILFTERNSESIKLNTLGKRAYFEIPIPFNSNHLFRWSYVVGGPLLLSILLYFVLCQKVIKGSKLSGILQITVPVGQFPYIPNQLKDTLEQGVFYQRNSDESSFYQLQLRNNSNYNVLELLKLLKESNPESEIRFQYNRSGEIL